jgi:replicative superfamily II helicase
MNDELNDNLYRIQYGVKDELVEYVKIKGVGRKKARDVYESEKRNPKLI